MDVLFGFAETTDPHLCDADSVIPSDCSGGDLYLTKKGNIIYSFYCYGSDTTFYDIGTYFQTDSGISCTFDRQYSYHSGCSDCTKDEQRPVDPNSGKLIKVASSSLFLIKLHCEDFEYYFESKLGKAKYVLSRTNKERTNLFVKEISQMKILSKL
jgi:hypothetical protein